MYGNFFTGSHDTITSRIDQDELHVSLRFLCFLPHGSCPRACSAIDGQSLTHAHAAFSYSQTQKGDMTEYDDRSNCASNMYLPNCTYYLSAPDFSSVSSFLPQTTSCQVNFPYSSNIAQVQPVREVAFRDYGLDHPSKWHYRGNYASYYPTEDIMHRDLLQSSTRTDVIFKNDSVYSHHGGSNAPCNLFTNVGRNGVLPQGFDQFFDTVNTAPEKPGSDNLKGRTESGIPGDDACNKLSADSSEQEKRDSSENVDEESSLSNCAEEKNNGPSSSKSRKRDAPTANTKSENLNENSFSMCT